MPKFIACKLSWTRMMTAEELTNERIYNPDFEQSDADRISGPGRIDLEDVNAYYQPPDDSLKHLTTVQLKGGGILTLEMDFFVFDELFIGLMGISLHR